MGSFALLRGKFKEQKRIPTKLYDSLIRIILSKKCQHDLRKMISTSNMWPSVAENVFERMSQLARENEDSPRLTSQLKTTRMVLISVIIESMCYNNIIYDFLCAIPSEYDALLAKYRIFCKE